MKPLPTALRALAAAVLLSVVLITSIPAGAKLHGRGFVEAGLGITTVQGSLNVEPDNGGGVALGYMLSFTYGIQKKNSFFGIGVGVAPRYFAVGSGIADARLEASDGLYGDVYQVDAGRLSGMSVPVFVNYRYDFFSSGSTYKPFIGLKAGFFIPSIGECSYEGSRTYWNNGEEKSTERYVCYEYLEGIIPYISLDFGVRKRLSASSGFSVGICIQNTNNSVSYYAYGWVDDNMKVGVSILAKIGFDF